MVRNGIMDFEPLADFLMMDSPEKLNEKYEDCPILRPLSTWTAFLESRTKNVMDDQLLQKTYSKIEELPKIKKEVSVTNFKNFEQFTEKLDQMIDNNAKNFDDLWKCSTNLADQYKALSINTHNMAGILQNCVEANSKFYKVIAATEGSSMDDPWIPIQAGIENYAGFMNDTSNSIEKRMAEFFHYHKNELKSLRELDYLRRYSLQNYKDSKKTLATEKANLFHTKSLAKWECNKEDIKEDLDMVFNDMKIAFKYILPKKTAELAKKKEIVEHLAYHQLSDSLMSIADFNKNIFQNFLKFGEDLKSIGEHPNSIWNILDDFANKNGQSGTGNDINKDAAWAENALKSSMINLNLTGRE